MAKGAVGFATGQSDVAEALRAHLLADGVLMQALSGAVHQNSVPQSAVVPFVWYIQSGADDGDVGSLDDAAGRDPYEVRFDLEIVSDDLDQTVAIAGGIRDRLHNHRGAFGQGTVLGVFVADQADDYLVKSIDSDKGFHAAALAVRVLGYAPPSVLVAPP